MKGIFKIAFKIFRCLLALLIFLFSITTLMGHLYLQTIFIWLLIAAIIYWPSAIREKLNQRTSTIIRLSSIIILFLISFLIFKPEPKSCIYLSDRMESELMEIYDEKVTHWPEESEDIYIETQYGKVRVKLGKIGDKVIKAMPEYEDCKRIAKEKNVPLMKIHQAVSNMLHK